MKLEMYDNSDFDRGAPRWKRGLWVIVRGVFFQNPCPWGSAFRSALLRLFGAKIGKGVGIGSNVNISFPWRLVMGDHVWIGDDVGILSLAQVTIESNVCVARRSFLCTGSHDVRREDFKLKVAPIPHSHWKLDCNRQPDSPWSNDWRGCGCFRWFGGLKDVPPNCLVRGNPATVVYEIFRGPESIKASGPVSRVRDKSMSAP